MSALDDLMHSNGIEEDPRGAYVYHDDVEPLIAELEAALAEMNARHCETCRHADKNGDPWGCRANMLLFPHPTECCNRWAERSTP